MRQVISEYQKGDYFKFGATTVAALATILVIYIVIIAVSREGQFMVYVRLILIVLFIIAIIDALLIKKHISSADKRLFSIDDQGSIYLEQTKLNLSSIEKIEMRNYFIYKSDIHFYILKTKDKKNLYLSSMNIHPQVETILKKHFSNNFIVTQKIMPFMKVSKAQSLS